MVNRVYENNFSHDSLIYSDYLRLFGEDGILVIKVQNDAVKTNSWSSACTETREMQSSSTS